MNTTFDNYPVKPYISLNRDVEAWLLKSQARSQMTHGPISR